MRLFTLFAFLFITKLTTAQVGITIVFDGPLTGGTPKFVELYVLESTNFSTWSLRNHNNGGTGVSNSTSLSTLGTVPAGSYVYVILTGNDDEFRTYFGLSANPTYTVLGGAPNVNGDDAISLNNGTSNVDVFGVIGVDGTGTSWDYEDGFATRSNLESPSSTFVQSQWNMSGTNVTDGCTTNASCGAMVTLGAITLPISLKSFTATPLDRTSALLSFATALEQNNDYFSIERSADGLRFSEIGRVQGAGNSLQTREYNYTDNTPLRGINYYRLKQVDYDGKYTFSPVVSLNFDGTDRGNGVRLSPQPVKDQLSVTLEQAFQQDARWELYDLSGRLLQAGTLAAEANSFSIQAATLTDGAYVLRITGDQQVITRKFEKN